jgi:hypothetical protein
LGGAHFNLFIIMQNIIKATFKEWTLDKLDAEFGLKQVRDCKIMKEWLAMSYTPDEYEKRYISDLQEILNLGGDEWNEVELEICLFFRKKFTVCCW